MSVCATCFESGIRDGRHDCPGIGEIQVTRHLGHGLIVDTAPARARIALTVLADAKWGATVFNADRINIAEQVLYKVVGYDSEHASLIVELVEDWRKPSVLTFDRKLTEAEMEGIKARWREAHGKPGTAHVVTELRAETPRDHAALDRVRALEAALWQATDGRTMPVSAVCHSIANDLRIALACEDHRPTPPDLSTGTRGEYSQWVVETKLGRRLAVCVDQSPYPEDARQQLEALRAAHPGTVFWAVRETTARTEEDW